MTTDPKQLATLPGQSRMSGAAAVMFAQTVVLGLGFVTHPLVGRLLGPASYGVYGVVLSLQSIFGLILTLGVPVAISRFVAQDDEHAHSILGQATRVQLLLGVIVGIGMFAGSPLLSRLLGDTTLTPYIAFAAAVVLSQSLYPVYVQFLSGMHRFNRQALLTIFYAVLKLAGAIALIFVIGVYGAFAGFAVGGVAAAALGWYWTRNIGGRKRRELSLRALLGFATMYILIMVGLQTLISLDLFMVKALLKDDVLAGYYNAAVSLSRISYLLLQGLGFVLLPSVAKLTRPGASHDEAVTFIADTLRYLIALIVPSVVLAAATSKPLIQLFYSNEYVPAAPALTILMVGVGALGFYLLLSNIVAGAGRGRVSLLILVAALALSAILGWQFIPRWGLLGAAWQTTISGLIALVFLVLYTFRTFRIPVPWRSTTAVLMASGLAVVPTYLWQATPLTLPLQYILAGVLYVAALVFLNEVRPADRERLSRIHPSLRWLKPTTIV